MDTSLALLNSIINVFTVGTYPIRPLLLVAYVALVFAVWFCSTRVVRDGTASQKRNDRRAWGARIVTHGTAVALVLLFCLPLILQSQVFHDKGIEQGAFVLFIAGDEITSSQLVHNHFGKMALEGALRLVPGSIEVADTGGALAPHLDVWVPWMLLLFFILAFVGSLIVAAKRIRDGKGPAQRFGIGVLCSITFFVALSKAVDGGIVSDGAGIALAAALAILIAPRKFAHIVCIAVIMHVSVLSLLAVTGWYESYRYFAFALARSVLLATVLLCISAALEPIKTRMRKFLLVLIAIGIALGITAFVHVQGASQRAYLAQPVSAGQTWFATYPWEARVGVMPAFEIGRMQIYDASEFAGIPTGLVLDAFNLPYWYYPISERRSSCTAPDRSASIEFVVLTRTSLVNTTLANGIITAEFLVEGHAPQGWLKYRGRIVYNPCVPRHIDVLREVTRVAGGSDELIFYEIFLISRPLPE